MQSPGRGPSPFPRPGVSNRELTHENRGGSTLTVAVVDVNDFKSINDTYGHQAGDACIRHVASVIGRNIRKSDWLARWGGDEFVLALRDVSPSCRRT
jgi:diguanylate cyclase